MILYNVTVNVDESIHQEWLGYMKTKHIPQVLATGCFCGYKMFRILSTQQENENSYSIQYFCNTTDDLSYYQQQHAAELQKEHGAKFGDKVLAFRTILETT